MSTITPSNRLALPFALALALLLAPSPAQAQSPSPSPSSSPDPDPLDSLRERFREGMEKYKSGAFADAIVIWESIYHQLGSDKGYRLAFDLARAYDELGEHIKAAEHYETYLDRVAARRNEGETLEPKVAKQESDARERLEKIAAIKGRIRVRAAAHGTVIVRVDSTPSRVAGFTTYVEPGLHTVSFGGGTSGEVRKVTVERGQVLELDPPDAPPPPPPPATEARYETRVEHPFSQTVLWVSAGVAVASFVVPVITYTNALSIKSDYESTSATASDRERLASDYESARSNAYASLVVPAVFTAAAGGLVAWYILGRRETRVQIAPTANGGPQGASLGFSGRF